MPSLYHNLIVIWKVPQRQVQPAPCTVFRADGVQLAPDESLAAITHYCRRQLISLVADDMESSFWKTRVLKHTGLEQTRLGVLALLLPAGCPRASYLSSLSLLFLCIHKGGK